MAHTQEYTMMNNVTSNPSQRDSIRGLPSNHQRKTALVTGASGGIGWQLAQLLAQDQYGLILIDIREKQLMEAKQQLLENWPGLQVETITADLAEKGMAEHIQQTLLDEERQVDILINNAGFGTLGFFWDTSWERESQMIHLHVLTLTHLTKLLLPGMVKRGYGKILNVASLAGFMPGPLSAVYNASKAYVLAFSEAIANEVRGKGVTVTVLCPGLTPTGFQAAVGVGDPELTANRWISTSAKEVALTGYQAMQRGRTIAIPGTINKLLVQAHRFLPRNMAARMVRWAQEKNRSFLKK
ncbi:MAG: SDR family oxidoreductase [Phaeodactylibacter sp.]|nr:SDR family oxidoreductase [Phaeodactylibacter sp.]